MNMTPINGGVAALALATPFFLDDQDTPTTKPAAKDDKTKPAAKPARKLSDFEKAAIKRIGKTDKKLAKKLAEKLPQKKSGKEARDYISKRLKKIADERKALKGAEKFGIKNPDRKKALDKLEKTLKQIFQFYLFGTVPKWFADMQKKVKKDAKKTPTTKPAAPQGEPRPTTPPRAPDGLILNFIAGERAIAF